MVQAPTISEVPAIINELGYLMTLSATMPHMASDQQMLTGIATGSPNILPPHR